MFNVGVIVGSTRNPRVCPQIAKFILKHIENNESPRILNTLNFSTIDLKDQKLPLFDESKLPRMITKPNEYDHQHTRNWSKIISKQDAFIVISPQYNWGIPGALKNAIDFLANEWAKKPVMVVTYGGNGGDKCNAQLNTVFTGMGMKTLNKNIMLSFPSKELLISAANGKNIEIESNGTFDNYADEISESFKEFYGKLSGNVNR